jgi:two-component system cell cycle sensor histidine kinase PleC
MPKLSASSAHPRRRERADSNDRKPGVMSDQARLALALVVIFAIVFVAVIGGKIVQERGNLAREGDLTQAQAAETIAERTWSTLARAQGSVAAVAGAIERSPQENMQGLLAGLVRDPLLLDAALVANSGAVVTGSNPVAEDFLGRAAAAAEGRALWTDAIGGDAPRLFIAAPLSDGRRVVAEIDTAAVVAQSVGEDQIRALTEAAQTLAITDAAGVILFADGARDAITAGGTAQQAFAVDLPNATPSVRSRGGGFAIPARIADVRRAIVGAAQIADTEIYVLVAGLRWIDKELWGRTLLFYSLLLVAPILVCVGLCAVLLMQMANIRVARAALQDQERRFRVAIESARCGVWDWNLREDTVFITDSLARMFGRNGAATMKGAEFVSLVRAQDQEKFAEAIRNAPSTGEVDVEFRAYSLPVWLHARGRPWTGAGDMPSGRVVGVAIDVTEQKGAQARVTAAETRLRAALESVSECFVLWDARRRLVLSNQKYREFFNLDTKLVKPGAAYEMLELAAQGAIKAVHPSVDEGARELELVDGRWIHFSERRTNDGGLVSIGTDITALKHQESLLVDREKQAHEKAEALRESQASIADLARRYEQEKIRAQEANRSKSEFLANMSHELRTPLNAINGFSEIMVHEMFGPLGDARYKEYATDILSSGQLLLALINDILDMSKIEAGKMKLSIETFRPEEVAEQCARLVRGRARDADLDFVVDLGEMPEITADPRALKQVLLNLTTNAIKFTPEGGQVVLEGRGTTQGVRFRVTDTGIGISRQDLQRIGKPFEQIESQQSKSHQGSGLGLALSRSLVELHGGRLTIESEIGRGTTVVVELPQVAHVVNNEHAIEELSSDHDAFYFETT